MKKNKNQKLIKIILLFVGIFIFGWIVFINLEKKENGDILIKEKAKTILKAIESKKEKDSNFNEQEITEKNIEELLGIPADNFKQVKIKTGKEEVTIFIFGKKELDGLAVCGTIDNLKMGEECKDKTSPKITLNGEKEIFLEINSEYEELGAIVTDNFDDDLEIRIDSSELDIEKIGIYKVYYNAIDTSGNKAKEVIRTVIVEDTTSPIISLVGSNVIRLKLNEEYKELGAIVTDNFDEELEIDINSRGLNIKKTGIYKVYYNAIDTSGNKAKEVVRTVIVEDTIPPVIKLIGSNLIKLKVNDEYKELGATVTDNYDKELEVKINSSELNLLKPGTYKIYYNAIDTSGNKAVEIIRTIIVEDTEKPTIQLNGDEEIRIEVNRENPEPYEELGAILKDNYNSDRDVTDITYQMKKDGVYEDVTEIDTSKIGEYKVIYRGSDSSGNEAVEVVRTVIVADTTSPVIQLNGDEEIRIEVNRENPEPYEELGATLIDNYDSDRDVTDITYQIKIDDDEYEDVTEIDTSKIGEYKVIYRGSDSSGNEAVEVVRTVIVADTTSPVIQLNGDEEIRIEVNRESPDLYEELGAILKDNYNSDRDVTDITYQMKKDGVYEDVTEIDTSEIGEYKVIYRGSDSSGNEAVEVVRTVIVADTTSPVIQLNGDEEIGIEVNKESSDLYEELGATLIDNYDEDIDIIDIIYQKKIDGEYEGISKIDTSEIGEYKVIYRGSDSSGNEAVEVVRTVIVADTTSPVIQLNGDEEIRIEVNRENPDLYEELGATLIDNYDSDRDVTDITYQIKIDDDEYEDVTEIDTSEIGEYKVIYRGSDSSGNEAVEVVRTVIVADTTSPVIQLNGDEEITLIIGDEYKELGATVTDNYDVDLEVNIDSSELDLTEAGTYEIYYNVTDSSGNEAEEVVRTVIVKEEADEEEEED
ncbi:MAG: immunoglobulin-like domain-containing protein [Bacilli bacterium]